MSPVSQRIRKQVFERANFRCEYCLAPEIVGVSMEVDQAEGDDNPDNLCLACDPCNAAKSNFQAGIDPQTDTETPLFNPRTHDWVEHFSWSGDFTEIIGLTPMGRATIERLNLNPEKRQIMRQLWIKLDLHPPGQ